MISQAAGKPADRQAVTGNRHQNPATETETDPATETWAQQLLSAYSSVSDLVHANLVTEEDGLRLTALGSRFRVRLPRYYAALFDGTAECPLRLQSIPGLGEEDPVLPDWATEWSREVFGRDVPWLDDAIGDVAKMAAPRLTHRYGNRAILHVSSACAMYCRFCFRKSHINATERTLYEGSLDHALDYLARTPEITELILTGGDPLSMPDSWIAKFFDRLETIESLKHVRIHSKMPCTLPARLTDELALAISNRRFVVSLVAHFNHPRELTSVALERLAQFRRAGIPLYSQSVLLRGVNDNVDTLASLFQTLYDNGVTPFYLHHADWTPGTFHFRVSIARGREFMRALSGLVSGPALPHYVLDLPGGDGKVSLLDTERVKLVKERHEPTISGAVYEITPPQTRAHAEKPILYADFWQ